jgi:serine/threonine protein kinase/WD40 repeat protein
MTHEHSQPSDREQRWQEVLVACIEAAQAGQDLDPEAWVQRYPEFAAELAEFFAGRARFERMAEPLRAPSPAAPAHVADAPTVAPAESTHSGSGPGTTVRYFGDYELLEEIARGGMGVVYRARQVKLNRLVAVKMILAGQLAGTAEVARFHAEAKAAANLQHPHIVAIHEVGEHEGQHYFSMDYVEGKSLADIVHENPLPARQAARYVQLIAGAIHYAHQHGTLHRDLKPSNVLIDTNDQPRVTDFGLAKRMEADSRLTGTGQVLGTPSYMPPEQAAADRGQMGPASDVYALGAVLYELVTGRPPFRAETPLDTLLQVLDTEPVPPRLLNPKVDRDLETICLKCLQKEPRRRYASAQDLADDLNRYLKGQPIQARPVGSTQRLWRWCRRNPVIASLAATVALSVIAGISASTYFGLQAAARAREVGANAQEALREKDRADQEAEQAQDMLVRSLYEQAQALRRSSQPGRRDKGLNLLKEAEKLRSRARKTELPPAQGPVGSLGLSAKLPTKWELRNEAAALLLAQDVRLAREMNLQTNPVLHALSPDGRLAAWYELDPKERKAAVQVVDLTAGGKSARWELDKPEGPLSISPDNKLMAFSTGVSPDLDIEFRDLWEGKAVKVIDWPKDKDSETGLPPFGNKLVFSPDGRYLAGVKTDSVQFEYVLWNLKTGQGKILSRQKKTAGAWVLFSTSGKLLAYPSGEKTITLWDVAKETRDREIELPLPGAGQPDFGLDDRLLALPCRDRQNNKITVLIWDNARNLEKARFPTRSAGSEAIAEVKVSWMLRRVAFRPGTNQLAVGDGPSIALVDALAGKELFRFDSGHMAALLLAWQPEGRHLISASVLENTFKIWELSDEPPLASLRPEVEKFAAFSFSPDGKWLAVASPTAPKAWLIHRQTGKVEREFASGAKGPFNQLFFRPDGKQIAGLRVMPPGEAEPVVWDLESGKEIARLDTKDYFVSAAFGSQGHLLVPLNQSGKLAVWDVNENRAVWQAPEPPADYLSLVGFLSADGRFLVDLQCDLLSGSQFIVWELPAGRKLGPFPLESTPLYASLSRDVGLVTVMYAPFIPGQAKAGGPALGVWSLPSGKQLMSLRGLLTVPAFSPDSGLLAVVTHDGLLKLWNIATGEELLSVPFQAKELVFTPDGSYLATPGPFGTPQEGHSSILLLDLSRLRRQLADIGLDW